MENKKAVKLTDFQKNEENPFMKQAIEGIENHVVKKYKSNSGGDKRAVVALADTETGEVFKTSFIRQIEVDEEQFTKLYLSNFAAFFDLSQAAIRVFGYFMTCMKPKNDLIIFNRKKCLEYTKYKTDKAVYKGLAELVKAEIIARGPADNLWFINPLIVFNGDRVTFAKTYVRKKTLAAQKKEEAEKRQLSLGSLCKVIMGDERQGSLTLPRLFMFPSIQSIPVYGFLFHPTKITSWGKNVQEYGVKTIKSVENKYL
ncbi:replication/maintenance protein RepL (plasmid) [Bacteroides uniformis]|nr:replication/maintenance protein RepL [Bacteroides uniformis]